MSEETVENRMRLFRASQAPKLMDAGVMSRRNIRMPAVRLLVAAQLASYPSSRCRIPLRAAKSILSSSRVSRTATLKSGTVIVPERISSAKRM